MERNHEKSVGAKVWQVAKRGGRLGAGSAGLDRGARRRFWLGGHIRNGRYGYSDLDAKRRSIDERDARMARWRRRWPPGVLGVAGGRHRCGSRRYLLGSYGAKKLYDKATKNKGSPNQG